MRLQINLSVIAFFLFTLSAACGGDDASLASTETSVSEGTPSGDSSTESGSSVEGVSSSTVPGTATESDSSTPDEPSGTSGGGSEEPTSDVRESSVEGSETTVNEASTDDPADEVPVTGAVLDVDGFPVEGARVLLAEDEIARTDAQGEFSLMLARDADWALTFEREGFVRDHKPVRLSEDAEGMDFAVVLTRQGQLMVLDDASEGGTLTGPLSGRVTFPPDAIVDAAGQPVHGPVALYMTPVDFGGPLGRESFPGTAAALTSDGGAVDLESFGVMDITFVDDGRGLRLGDDATASIEIPLTAGSLGVGDTTPLWSLDPETGLWQQEGMGEVVRRGSRNFLVGEVGHFSWWNCDIGIDADHLSLEVYQADGAQWEERFSVLLAFGRDQGVFRPFVEINRGLPSPRVLLPVEREVQISVFATDAEGTRLYGEVTKTIAAGRTEPVRVDFEAELERFLVPRDEQLEITMAAGDAIYLDVPLEADEVRHLELEATEGLVGVARSTQEPRFGAARPLSGGHNLSVPLYSADGATLTTRFEATAAGTLRAGDGTPDLLLNEIRRVELDGDEPVRFDVFLREGEWIRAAGRSADPENTTTPFMSVEGFSFQDGWTNFGTDIWRVGRTDLYTFRVSTNAFAAGEYDVVLRRLDAPQPVPLSPSSLGATGELSLALGEGRLFALPYTDAGSVEGWVRSLDGESGVAMFNRVFRGDESFGNAPGVRRSPSVDPRTERGFAGQTSQSQWSNLHVLVFVGLDDGYAPGPLTEVEYVLAAWSGEQLDELVVGDPDVAGCEPNARTAMEGWRHLDAHGRIRFCEGTHNLRDGRIDLDVLDMQGAGMDETLLTLWPRSGIEDGRGGLARAEAQHWVLRDFSLEAQNMRVGNEGQPAIGFEARSEPSTLLVERIRIIDRNGERIEGSTYGGSGIDIADRTPASLEAVVRDSEFEGFDTAIRPYSSLRTTIENVTIGNTRRGIFASDARELIVRDSSLEVTAQGISHSGSRAQRSVFEDNLLVRGERNGTDFCLSASTLQQEGIELDEELTIVRNNTCVAGDDWGGIWVLASGPGGALIEGNRTSREDPDAIFSSAVRIQWSTPLDAVTDNPGPIRVVNNVFDGHRRSQGVISIDSAHLQGPVEIVNNTIHLVEGGGSSRTYAIRAFYPGDTTGALPLTFVNNLINGALDARDDGIVMTNDDVSFTSAGNFFANLRRNHVVAGTSDVIAGYGVANTSQLTRVTLDGEGRPVAGSASIDAGVDRAEVPDTDIDGVTRPQGGGVDAGAHEQ